MNYIVCGIDFKSGTKEDDSILLNQYFELGWEMVGSRMDVIAQKNMGLFDQENTTIVTLADRMFMYQKLFKNVISSKEFLQRVKTEPGLSYRTFGSGTNSRVKDWAWDQQFSFLNFSQHCDESGRYVRYVEDFDDIFDGYQLNEKYSNENFKEKFLVAGFRSRAHLPNKNSSNEELKVIKKFIKAYSLSSRMVFVVGMGKEVETFCTSHDFTHVDKLADFVSLIKNENCICHITPSTGTALTSYHAAVCPIIQIDYTGAATNFPSGPNAIVGGKPSHFFQGGIKYMRKVTDEFLTVTLPEMISDPNSIIKVKP